MRESKKERLRAQQMVQRAAWSDELWDDRMALMTAVWWESSWAQKKALRMEARTEQW